MKVTYQLPELKVKPIFQMTPTLMVPHLDWSYAICSQVWAGTGISDALSFSLSMSRPSTNHIDMYIKLLIHGLIVIIDEEMINGL
jgi:hypothetical protein